jgi:hypothetical protein
LFVGELSPLNPRNGGGTQSHRNAREHFEEDDPTSASGGNVHNWTGSPAKSLAPSLERGDSNIPVPKRIFRKLFGEKSEVTSEN